MYANDFYNRPKKSKVVTLRDRISLFELKSAAYDLQDSARKNQTIVELLHKDYQFERPDLAEKLVIEDEYDQMTWSVRIFDNAEKKLSSFIRKLEEERIGILEFTDKYHDYIDTDIPYIKNKEIGLKKILQWYLESIQDLGILRDIFLILKEACSLHITKKSKLDRWENDAMKYGKYELRWFRR